MHGKQTVIRVRTAAAGHAVAKELGGFGRQVAVHCVGIPFPLAVYWNFWVDLG
jgi:hypothetical protein